MEARISIVPNIFKPLNDSCKKIIDATIVMTTLTEDSIIDSDASINCKDLKRNTLAPAHKAAARTKKN